LPWDIAVRQREFSVDTLDVVGRLADPFKVANHRAPHQLAAGKAQLIHVPGVSLDALDGAQDVTQVVRRRARRCLCGASLGQHQAAKVVGQ